MCIFNDFDSMVRPAKRAPGSKLKAQKAHAMAWLLRLPAKGSFSVIAQRITRRVAGSNRSARFAHWDIDSTTYRTFKSDCKSIAKHTQGICMCWILCALQSVERYLTQVTLNCGLDFDVHWSFHKRIDGMIVRLIWLSGTQSTSLHWRHVPFE